ncbi:MAG: hypothetical protein QXD23_03505 [Candidatus Micrarchaeaceae archaeon]
MLGELVYGGMKTYGKTKNSHIKKTSEVMSKNKQDASINEKFDWQLYPETEAFLNKKVNEFLSKNPFAKKLSNRMLSETSTKFFNWIDHMVIPESFIDEQALINMGFSEFHPVDKKVENGKAFKHSRSYFFPIILGNKKTIEISLKPEELDSFIQAMGIYTKIEGEPYSRFRKAKIFSKNNYLLSAIERRGYDGFLPDNGKDVKKYLNALSTFFTRQRIFESDDEGMIKTCSIIKKIKSYLDTARLSDAFFRSERAYWEKRNRAGQIQKARQDTLGLGWGNKDHHTYRSSRKNFSKMINIFESIGYNCREKYYAGDQARWGAQIMEHEVCDTVVFTDVDLYPEETDIDFPHKGLVQKNKLGTVGLWVGLHGESILQAGMHHLEARFDFENLKIELPKFGITVMPPFSNFEFLKQAFTVGEKWQVEKKRADILLKNLSITKEQHDIFIKEGAIGSHMENLERTKGFKGFNKSSVTKIIKATDPRSQNVSGA